MTKSFSIIILLLLFAFNANAQKKKDILSRVCDSLEYQCGYMNSTGEIVIPIGKYGVCFTDSFDQYAIVLDEEKGFVAIDRNETIMYEVYPFDNGPDYPSEGTFRIIKDNLIGYADEKTGKVIIEPKYNCASPFSGGVAEVSTNCVETVMDENHGWDMKTSHFINKKGKTKKSKKKH